MGEPLMDGCPATNVFEEHEYKIRVTFGASTVSTILAKDVTVTRPTATTLVLTFGTPYAEITTLAQGWAKATGADPLQYQITTNAISTTGVVTLTSVSMNSAGTATAPASGDVLYLEIGVARNPLNSTFTQSTA